MKEMVPHDWMRVQITKISVYCTRCTFFTRPDPKLGVLFESVTFRADLMLSAGLREGVTAAAEQGASHSVPHRPRRRDGSRRGDNVSSDLSDHYAVLWRGCHSLE